MCSSISLPFDSSFHEYLDSCLIYEQNCLFSSLLTCFVDFLSYRLYCSASQLTYRLSCTVYFIVELLTSLLFTSLQNWLSYLLSVRLDTYCFHLWPMFYTRRWTCYLYDYDPTWFCSPFDPSYSWVHCQLHLCLAIFVISFCLGKCNPHGDGPSCV